MPTTADFRNGLCLELDGQIYKIVWFQHVKPGKGPAFVKTKLKNLTQGGIKEKTFTAGVKVTTARVERFDAQFLYRDQETYYFMDQNTYDTIAVPQDLIVGVKWLKEGQHVEIMRHSEKQTLLGCELPPVVPLKVAHTEIGVEGNTATKALKPATLEIDQEIQVPLFIHSGDLINIDTREGKYLDRLQKA